MLVANRQLWRPLEMLLPNGAYGSTPAMGGQTTGAGTANMAYYQWFVAPYTTAVTAISFYCASGTNNHDLAILAADGTRLVSRGSTATTATAVNTWTLSTPQPVTGGVQYWVGFATAGTKSVAYVQGHPLRNMSYGVAQQASALPIPSSATFATNTGTLVPLLKLTFAG